ncbi:LysR substrate-binding domain-containing protein [Schlegelella sp. S2-27]|uniref:LysR substrate-binding domain-containing protein n=1 Tax=Caldimonas mangrovi TaxID=2944811 RepID=A0ABT0YT44_9BURK|nr:LysR substrate-binding domain-containing protein [Caldimonas mangrovi]MCM5681924.1 LysR substrate-binding domain-containing protein [Caldimonas mangrovi]
MNLVVSLKYLVALDDHRHFGRAALACHVTQPALSNAIRALEASFGTAIVKRGRNFGGFTVEGERILASARRILREQELLQQDLAGSAEHPRGQLLIGAVPTAMPIAARFAAILQDRHPGIVPTLRSMSSIELETGLEHLALDMALGYAERTEGSPARLRIVPQYVERYYLLRKARGTTGTGMQVGPPVSWAQAADLPLCLLGAEMHNRTIVDGAFAAAGIQVSPAIETNSILALMLSVVAGRVCSVMPGALVDVALAQPGIEALPLEAPHIEVPIAFMVHETDRQPRTVEAALALAEDPAWRQQVERHACC